MQDTQHYAQPKSRSTTLLNPWDLIAFILFLGLMTAIVWGVGSMTQKYELGQSFPISTDPRYLPQYAIATVLRMTIALGFSLVFTFILGSWAAKSARAEKVIIPFIDIMQSVPILGFLSFTVMIFIHLFPNNRLGPECAAIFAIFTSQVWNMTLSFYQSLLILPADLKEAAAMFKLNFWQKFWRIEVPFATPALIWNTMMSMSAGWFFVVASEAITVNNQRIMLPGIGSYIKLAQEQANYSAIAYVIITMFIVIILYDQLLFRPLMNWSAQFQPEPSEDVEPNAWFLTLLRRSKLVKVGRDSLIFLKNIIIYPLVLLKKYLPSPSLLSIRPPRPTPKASSLSLLFWNVFLIGGLFISIGFIIHFIQKTVTYSEIFRVFYLGSITALKIAILILLSSILWVPIGVWIGLHPTLSRQVQPIAQFLAAFPANLLYPVTFMLIITYQLNVDIWTAPLMILGTQWYILFNVIAGTRALSVDLKYAAKNYQIKGWLWWKKIMLPSIYPYYVTGAMTAAGGCWNASIIADVVEWGNKHITATGLGGYITEFTTTGDFPRITLGIVVMCLYVTILNRLVWRNLYNLAETRYHLS